MIVVKVKWSGEPEQMTGPFGRIEESLRWINEFKEALHMNLPNTHATLTTHIIHDPVQAMHWAKSGTNPYAVMINPDRPCVDPEDSNSHSSDVIVPEELR